jgi:hypothetical protein
MTSSSTKGTNQYNCTDYLTPFFQLIHSYGSTERYPQLATRLDSSPAPRHNFSEYAGVQL